MLDVFARCANAQSLAGDSGTVVTNGSLPLSGSASYLRDLGAGDPVSMRFYIDSAITNATSIEFQVVLASNTALSSNVLVLASTGAVVLADLIAGAYFDAGIPAVAPTLGDGLLRQHLGGRLVIVGTVGAGTFSAGLTLGSAGRPRKLVTGYVGP